MKPADTPQKPSLEQILEQWRKAEQEQQDRVEMRDFQNTFGLGVGQ